MNATNESSDLPVPQPSATQPIRPGWFQRHFNRRALIRFAVGVGILLLIVVLFYQEEKVRGRRAWERYKQELASQGISLDVKTVLPPPIPPEQNFARTPLFMPIYATANQQVRSPDPSEVQKLFELFDEFENTTTKLGYGFWPNQGGNWRDGRWPDIRKVFGVTTTKHGEPVANYPQSTAKAAELILNIFRQTTGAVLDELQTEAKLRRFSNYDVNWDTDMPHETRLPYLLPLKKVAQQSALRAMAALELKQAEQAHRDIVLGLHCGETLKNDPPLISFMVTVAMRENAITPVWYGLATHQWSASQIAQLQERLQAFDTIAGARQALHAERIINQRGLDGFARHFPEEILFSDLIQCLVSGNDDLFCKSSPSDRLIESCVSHLYPKGWFYFEQINFQRAFLEYFIQPIPTNQVKLDVLAYETAADGMLLRSQSDGILILPKKKRAMCLLLPSMTTILSRSANNQMACTLAATACALERYRLDHGAYPKQLADLVPQYLKAEPFDYMSGQTLKYQLKADGTFLLYSFGRNGVDDGGKVVLRTSGVMDQNEGDWVWQYPSTPASP